MSVKSKRIVSYILMAAVALLLTMSSLMKLSGADQVTTELSKAGLGPYIKLLGVIELLSVALFLYPKTFKIGFLLLCCYLGGALSIELAGGQAPVAAVFLVITWVSVYLRDKLMLLDAAKINLGK